jgi:hypothetical protein
MVSWWFDLIQRKQFLVYDTMHLNSEEVILNWIYARTNNLIRNEPVDSNYSLQ